MVISRLACRSARAASRARHRGVSSYCSYTLWCCGVVIAQDARLGEGRPLGGRARTHTARHGIHAWRSMGCPTLSWRRPAIARGPADGQHPRPGGTHPRRHGRAGRGSEIQTFGCALGERRQHRESWRDLGARASQSPKSASGDDRRGQRVDPKRTRGHIDVQINRQRRLRATRHLHDGFGEELIEPLSQKGFVDRWTARS